MVGMEHPVAIRPAILVAENDQELRAVVVDCVQPFGLDVVEAANGYELFDRIEGRDVRLIITDTDMPGAGLQYLSRLRKYLSCPIVALITPAGTLSTEVLAMGATACLERSFRSRDLRDMVATLLGNRG